MLDKTGRRRRHRRQRIAPPPRLSSLLHLHQPSTNDDQHALIHHPSSGDPHGPVHQPQASDPQRPGRSITTPIDLTASQPSDRTEPSAPDPPEPERLTNERNANAPSDRTALSASAQPQHERLTNQRAASTHETSVASSVPERTVAEEAEGEIEPVTPQPQELSTNNFPRAPDDENDPDSCHSSDNESYDDLDNIGISASWFSTDVLKLFRVTESEEPELPSDSDSDDPTQDDGSSEGSTVKERRLRAFKAFRTVSRKLSSGIMTAILTLYGKARYTIDSYVHLVAVFRKYETLPSSNTMRQRCLPYLLDHMFVPSKTIKCVSKAGHKRAISKSTASGSLSTTIVDGSRDDAVVVLPSSWARLDLRCIHVLREIACLSGCRCSLQPKCSNDIRVERTARVAQKDKVNSRSYSLWVNHNGVPCQAPLQSRLVVHTFLENSLPSNVSDSVRTDFGRVKYRGEDANAFTSTLLATYMVQRFDSGAFHLSPGLLPSPNNNTQSAFFDACVAHLRLLCPRGSERNSNSQTNPTKRRRLAEQQNERDEVDEREPLLRAGDLLSILTFDDSSSQSFLIVHLSRYWVDRLDDDRQLIIFLSKQDDGSIQHDHIPSFGVPSLHTAFDEDLNEGNSQCRTTGTLDSGETFYMYRILLYADDFNPRSQLFPRGSVGGVYMSPMGLPLRSRRSQASIRTVSLTPPGVSTNFILNYIVYDIVQGTLHGFECIDAFDKPCVCFFDIMGFVADYPASSAAVDVTGHTSIAPCTHCGFNFSTSLVTSKFSYTTSITSCNSIFMRTQLRTNSIRSTGLKKETAKRLGMKHFDGTMQERKSIAPLLYLADEFNKELCRPGSVPRMRQPEIDGYNINIIAPDHLFTGLIKGLLLCTFRHLESDEDKDHLQILLSASLLEYGFQYQHMIYTGKKLVPGLTMSMLYALFTALPHALRSLDLFETLATRHMINSLHKLICLSFWWPDFSTDGAHAFKFVHGARKHLYHRAIRVLSSNFVKSVDKYAVDYPHYRSVVDRPNTHRLLELTSHTIPLYSHVLFICELVFESSHQPLKFFLSRNHLSNSHLYAVKMVLAKDWLMRLNSLWTIYKSDHEPAATRELAMLNLMRLCCGDIFDTVDWNDNLVQDIKDDIKKHVVNIFEGTVEERLHTWYSDTSATQNNQSRWTMNMKTVLHVSGHTAQMSSITYSIRTLSRLLSIPLSEILVSTSALLQRGYGSGSLCPHERLNSGDVVQILSSLHDNSQTRFIHTTGTGQGNHLFLVVGFIIRCGKHGLWAAVRQCSVPDFQTTQLPAYNKHLSIQATIPEFYTSDTTPFFSFLRLDGVVRKVGVMHNCSSDKQCVFERSTGTVHHSRSTLTGGSFFLLPRWLGYPPRRS